MRRKAGIGAMALGLLLVMAALALLLYNNREDATAGAQAESVQQYLMAEMTENGQETTGTVLLWNQISQQLTDDTDGTMDAVRIEGNDYIGILTIPSLGLELPIMETWSYAGMKIAPGRYTGSIWADDLVICGHNYSRHFGTLKNLAVGDQIYFTDVNGVVLIYQVGGIEILQPTAVEEMVNSDWDLSLFTCTIGGKTRVTVRCQRSS